MESQPFLLVELEDLSSIFNALKTTSRIKYTCFNVSNNYLIFGATSGGLYVFRREPCCFLQILPNKEGSVTQVAISPDEKLIAFSTVKGLVCILEKSSHGAKHLMTASEHQNEQVTCLQWNEGSNELFIGDNSGKVSIVTVSVFPSKSMFQNPSFVLMQLESKIVQMDFSSNMLLVSTLTKCYICDTTKEIFRQVGHKLRDGEYGACIFNTQNKNEVVLDSSKAEGDKYSEYPNLSHLKLFCARPGSRIWEVGIDGTVISTHHFKEALAVPPNKIHFLESSKCSSDVNHSTLSNGTCDQVNSHVVEQSFNFQKLYNISPKFFLTYKPDGIYVFDPQKASVVLWNNEITNIVDVKCVNDVIYVWSGYGKMYALNLVPLEKYLTRLYFQKKYSELAKLCLEHESFLLAQANNSFKLHILHDLDVKLKSDELRDRLKPFIDLCKENAEKRKNQNAQILQSGIYLVSNLDQMLLDDKRTAYQKYLRPSYLNLKGRSHSVSPERLQNGDLRHQGSCSSLPDLGKGEKIEESAASPPSQIVVNGRKVKEPQETRPAVDTENVTKAIAILRNSPQPSNESVFSLFDKILALSGCSQVEIRSNLELVHLLPFNTYFNTADVNFISELFNSVLQSKALLGWLEKFTGAWLSKAVENYPNFLKEHHSTGDLESDYRLSRILRLFSSVLNEDEILETVRKLEMPCYYASFNTILDVYHDSSISNLNLGHAMSTPKFLNRIYFLINVGQIEQCSKYSHKSDLRDIFYLTLKFEESSRASGKSNELVELQCTSEFLSYLDKTCGGETKLAGCCDMVETYVIDRLENIVSTATRMRDSNCRCGFPCPNPQPSVTMFASLGHALLEKNWPRNRKKCVEICGRVPYLWRYLIFLRRNEPLPDLLPLLLQSGELEELENRCQEINKVVLECCLKHLISLKKGNCLNCGEKLKTNGTVTWATFGILCIKLLGPEETLELFRKHSPDINSKELNQVFYQSVIFSAIMEKHREGLRKNVVDLLTGKGTEETNRTAMFSEKLSEEILGKKCPSEFPFQNAKVGASHHWGAKVNLKNNCPICSLPLETKVLISEAGLVVFKCSHVFHSACLRKVNLECPVCKKKSG